MRKLRRSALVLLAAVATAVAGLASCQPTSHAVAPAEIGEARAASDLERIVDEPGPVTVETVVGADWEVPRAGLVNLEHPTAKEAHLADGPEPIVIAFHAIRHPTRGLYIVDTGVERALRDAPEQAALSGIAARAMDADKIRVRTDTASWLAKQGEPLRGVMLTHLHLDHLTGLRDVPDAVPIFTGPGEASAKGFLNAFVRGPTDAALAGKGPLHEWRFAKETGGSFAGVVDVFGDATVWAIHVPGHTPGSTAYLARTPDGPVLFTGDASHTAWGWEHDVEPGTYSADGPRSAESFTRLRAFVARHPRIDVRLGHQSLPNARASAAR